TPEVWAIGLRNPFRWSFDRVTGDMWIGDVGQNAKEEINFREAGSPGANYGWPCYEGTIQNININPLCDPPGKVAPVFEYNNPGEGRSVIGGYVY
ncbi:MAG TPA: PQQ-dependent sugar dehydrogenase, partial [Niabella sp.]|nr:PQQ-dependent sugar dehydrogenase [Niabella sp.]